jgi:peroxiredoxin
MKPIQLHLALAFTLSLGLNLASAQAKPVIQGPVAPEPLPTFEVDAKGKRLHMDFNLAPTPISDASLKFSQFAKQKLLVFYFSASCSHCQHAAPHVQQLSQEIASKGFKSIAIAIKNNSAEEIREFIAKYKLQMPVFYDETKEIGEKYGTGSIPLLFVVNEKGEYIRHKAFDANQTPGMVRIEATQFAAK